MASSNQIIGADICGECPASVQTILDSSVLDQDDRVNSALLKVLEQPGLF